MSKDDKIHKWIEAQNPEKKAASLAALKQSLGIPEQSPKKPRFVWRKLTPVFISIALVLGIGIFALVKFLPTQEENKNRYCTLADYSSPETQLTLKEYGEQIGEDLLYFNWYENATKFNFIYTLNETGEYIGFKEELTSNLTGINIVLYVTDIYTELQELDPYKINCIEKSIIENVNVSWSFDIFTGASMYWEYKGFRYCLTAIGPTTSDEALELVAELLP